MIIPFNISSTHQQEWRIEHKPWSFNGEPLPVNLGQAHVGIQRAIKGIGPTVDRIASPPLAGKLCMPSWGSE